MLMKLIPGVTQVGKATAPVTNSTWNAVKVFQDSASAIIYPTGLILAPELKNGYPIVPEYQYNGYIGNTDAVKVWTLQLYRNAQLK